MGPKDKESGRFALKSRKLNWNLIFLLILALTPFKFLKENSSLLIIILKNQSHNFQVAFRIQLNIYDKAVLRK